MGYRHVIQVVDSHTAGDPLRLIVGGIPAMRGFNQRKGCLSYPQAIALA